MNNWPPGSDCSAPHLLLRGDGLLLNGDPGHLFAVQDSGALGHCWHLLSSNFIGCCDDFGRIRSRREE